MVQLSEEDKLNKQTVNQFIQTKMNYYVQVSYFMQWPGKCP